MSPEQAATLNRLLDTLLALPVAQRAGWLDDLGAEHAALKPRLRALLTRSAELGDNQLATLPKLDETDEPVTHFRTTHEAGATVGAYRLLRQLGVGAMGAVWLAARTDGLAPAQVALKFAHVAARRTDLQARLAREHQLLLALDHPNIARVFDADVSEEGQPYLVLEYVSGRPLDQYIAAEQPSLPARLRLFAQLAHAVAHAHHCQIVHRDLKPANVLVTDQHGVRLLDFGIGKLLAHGVPTEFQLSRMTGQPLTPAYASPEQVLGAAVGLPSDVYSLGVMLYELLTGQRPHAAMRGSNLALRTAILEHAPVPASSLFAPELRAALHPQQHGQLDAIIAQALHKQPSSRFPSAHELAAAIDTLLAS